MKRLWRAAAAPAVVVLLFAAAPGLPQFRADLQFFARELPKRHKNAFHGTTSERFEAAVGELERRLDSLDEDGFYVGLMRIAATIGDAHTRVRAPDENARIYPLVLATFDADYRVVQAGAGAESALGARLVRIDDTPAERFYPILAPLATQNESPTYAPALVNLFLRDARILHGAGVTHHRESARFTLEDDRGRQFATDLAAVTADQARTLAWTPLVKKTQFGELSEPMRNPAPTFSYTYAPAARTVYADVRSMRDVGGPARELLTFVRERQADKLIVDLRRNPGGDYFHGLHGLIEPIARLPEINRKGHLFVLIGPLTGSAAIINACQFHTMTQGILVGEPIGARPTEYSEGRTMALPNTRLEVGYSVRFYDFSFNRENVVLPDHEVKATWADVKAGRSPVLEWCLNYKEE